MSGQTIGEAFVEIRPDTQGFEGETKRGLSGPLLAVGKAAAFALGGVAVAGGAVGLKTAASMEQARISFETMLGSASKADAFLRDLSSFAAKTPFEFPELQTAASSLVSAGVEASKVIPIMTSLGDVTSGMGTGSEGVKRATVALQQMAAAGRITGEDLNQLRDAGVPVFDLLAAATGKSKEAVAQLAQSGKLGKKEMEQLFTALETGKGLERFNGLMEKQSASLSGLFSTLKDTVTMTLANLITPAIPAIKAGLGFVSDFVSNVFAPGLSAAFSAIGDVISRLQPVFQRVKDFITGVFEILVNGDYTGLLGRALGVEEDSRIIGFLFTVRETVLEAMQTAREAFAVAADYVRANFVPALQGIAGFVTGTLLPAYQRVAQFLIATFTPTFKALADFITGTAMPAWRGLMERVKDNLPELMALAKGIGIVIAGLAALVAKVLGAVLPVLIDLAGFLGKTLFAAIGLVIGIVGGLVRAWQTIAPAVSAVIGLVGSLLSGFIGIVRGVLNTVVGIFTGDFGRIKTGVGQALGGVLELMTALPRRILGALGDLGGLLVDAGKELIAGLISGITAKLGALKDKMAAVANTVKRFLPGSPVKEGPLTAWNNGAAGKALMELVASGISGGPVARALNDALDLGGLRVGGPSFVQDRLAMSSSTGDGATAGGDAAALLERLVASQERTEQILSRMPRDYQLAARAGVGSDGGI